MSDADDMICRCSSPDTAVDGFDRGRSRGRCGSQQADIGSDVPVRLQGVPPAFCNINVHHHLRRSYEMLATVRVQPPPSRPRPLPRGPVGQNHGNTLTSSHSSPPREDASESAEGEGGKGLGKQPWIVTNIHSHHRNIASSVEPKSKWCVCMCVCVCV